MKRNILLLACAAVVLIGAGTTAIPALTSRDPVVNQPSSTTTANFDVRGMTCAGCAIAVKMAAGKVDGVTEVTVSYEDKRARVTYDSTKATPLLIAKAITEGSGFKAGLSDEP